jgi:uncharacterized protein (TIGR01777 family)
MSLPKRIIITGATGLIGKRVARALRQRGESLVVFSRDTPDARKAVRGADEYVAWQPEEQGPWANAVPGAHAVVHLAGAPVYGHRWTESYKRQIRDSRVLGTRGLVRAMARAAVRPKVFICGSAVGYYGPRDDTPLDESAGPGDDFLAQVCAEWEAEARKAEALGVRTVLLRTGVVLDRGEGALPQMMLPFKLFAGGPIMPGTQWLSWIHIDDEVGILLRALDDPAVSGPVNATAPNPQTNAEFTRALGQAMGRPAWLPVPQLGLKLALGEFAESLTTGQRVLPARIQQLGYEFRYPTSEQALRQLLGS